MVVTAVVPAPSPGAGLAPVEALPAPACIWLRISCSCRMARLRSCVTRQRYRLRCLATISSRTSSSTTCFRRCSLMRSMLLRTVVRNLITLGLVLSAGDQAEPEELEGAGDEGAHGEIIAWLLEPVQQ